MVQAKGEALRANDALATLLLSVSLFLLAGPYLAAWGLGGMVVTQVLAFALPALLVASTRESGFLAIGFARPSSWAVLAAVLLGLSLWFWNLHLIAPISEAWSSQEVQRSWQDFVALDSRPLVVSLVLFALLPAICEELLHRGIIAPSLARYLGLWPAVIVSALIFGLFHMSLSRLLPTATLGAAAAYLRLRSGSLLPSILIHFLYNACLLAMAAFGQPLPGFLVIPALLISGIAVAMMHKASNSTNSD